MRVWSNRYLIAEESSFKFSINFVRGSRTFIASGDSSEGIFRHIRGIIQGELGVKAISTLGCVFSALCMSRLRDVGFCSFLDHTFSSAYSSSRFSGFTEESCRLRTVDRFVAYLFTRPAFYC